MAATEQIDGVQVVIFFFKENVALKTKKKERKSPKIQLVIGSQPKPKVPKAVNPLHSHLVTIKVYLLGVMG